MKTAGRFQREAMLRASWKTPWWMEPSPKEQRQTRFSLRYLKAQATPAAQEALGGVEDVHGAAAPAGGAGALGQELGHDLVGADALGDGLAVVAVGDDHGVIGLHGGGGGDGDGLLADVEVAEAAEHLLLIGSPGDLLDAADEHHLVHGLQELGLGEVAGVVGACFEHASSVGGV
jgi:hypothetical protein